MPRSPPAATAPPASRAMYTCGRYRRTNVRIARTQLLKLVEELPETVEIEDVLYRLALRERLAAAEEDIREGKILSEDEVEAEIARWFSE